MPKDKERSGAPLPRLNKRVKKKVSQEIATSVLRFFTGSLEFSEAAKVRRLGERPSQGKGREEGQERPKTVLGAKGRECLVRK